MMNSKYGTEQAKIKKALREITRLQNVMAANPDSEIIRAYGAGAIEEQEHEIHILQN